MPGTDRALSDVVLRPLGLQRTAAQHLVERVLARRLQRGGVEQPEHHVRRLAGRLARRRRRRPQQPGRGGLRTGRLRRLALGHGEGHRREAAAEQVVVRGPAAAEEEERHAAEQRRDRHA